jgi:hypothetical protein
MDQPLRAISIQQPWAELILRGEKTIELRSWVPNYRGKLWLHTGVARNAGLERRFGLSDPFRGGYVGSFILEAVVPLDARRWELWRPRHLHPGVYRSGMYGLILSSPLRFPEPIAGPGKLGLFYPSPPEQLALRQAEPGQRGMEPA